jgi:hypothetical protein
MAEAEKVRLPRYIPQSGVPQEVLIEYLKQVAERERLEWIEEVKRINAKYTKKENERTFQMLHNSGRLKLVKVHESTVSENYCYEGRKYKVKQLVADLDVYGEKTEDSLKGSKKETED